MKMRWAVSRLAMAAHVQAEVAVFVSPDATPDGDGSRQKPYRTLVQARDAIRALRKAGSSRLAKARNRLPPAGQLPAQCLV